MSLVRPLGPEPDMSTQQRKDKYFGAHEFQAREEVVKTSSDRGFGLMFGVVFGLIAGYGAYRGSTLWPYWLAASGALATVALSVPRVLALPNRLLDQGRSCALQGGEPGGARAGVLCDGDADQPTVAAPRQR